MNTTNGANLKDKINFTEKLIAFCQSSRSKRRDPHIAAAAAEREITLLHELEEMRAACDNRDNRPTTQG